MSSPPVVNVQVQHALSRWGAAKNHQSMAGVLRACVTGELLLDATDSTWADPAAPFAPGDRLAIAEQVDNAGQRLLLVYTSNERLQVRRGGQASSLVQPAAAVFRMAIEKYDGVAIDADHPDVFIAYRAELSRHLTEHPEANLPLVRIMTERTAPYPDFLAALGEKRTLYLPFVERRDGSGAVIGRGAVTATDRDGRTLSVLGTSPAEIWSWAPDAGVLPTTWANVARVARDDGHAGIMLDPASAAITVTTSQLP